MATRGLVGYKKDGKIIGYYNHSDSYYEGLGLVVLDYFRKYSAETISDFFLKRATFLEDDPEGDYYNNHYGVFRMDWEKDTIELEDGSEFITNGTFCEYGYVFNLDDETLELYRGLFPNPQTESEIAMKEILDAFGAGNPNARYVHMVLAISKGETELAREMFVSTSLYSQGGKYSTVPAYPEEIFINNLMNKRLL